MSKKEPLVIINQECYSEYVFGSCTYRPSSSGYCWDVKGRSLQIQVCLPFLLRKESVRPLKELPGLSRNKVAVGEPAAGTKIF